MSNHGFCLRYFQEGKAGMDNLLKLLDPYRWLIAGVLILSVVAGLGWYRHSLIQEGVKREQANVAKAVAEQEALAKATANNLQEVADEAQSKYEKAMADKRDADKRSADALARLRSRAASAEQLAGASKAALGEYAADAERDIDWCGERLAATGSTAAEASAAAWALNDAWPEYKEFQDRLTTFTNSLKGTP